MKTTRKAKVSVTLDRDLLAAIDRRATRGATRSQVIEEWLRLSALAQAHRDLETATAAYYEGRTADQRAEDEALAAFSTRGFGRLDLDRKPRPRQHRAR
jgi:metal-responsive CopG/Arc/MetJ family transcriptional regulator